MWRECIRGAYTPEALYTRIERQMRPTFANRKAVPVTRARLNVYNIRRAVSILRRLIWQVGIRADYRRLFWRMVWSPLRRGDIESRIHIGVAARHLILFARECMEGNAETCFYSPDAMVSFEVVGR